MEEIGRPAQPGAAPAVWRIALLGEEAFDDRANLVTDVVQNGVLGGGGEGRAVDLDEGHAVLFQKGAVGGDALFEELTLVFLRAGRGSNPHLKHETYQIAMDGTEKLPQRILSPVVDALQAGQPLAPFAFAVAAWMRYASGKTDTGAEYALRDPRETELTARADAGMSAEETVARLMDLPGLFPPSLRSSTAFREAVTSRLRAMMATGMRKAVEAEAASLGS